jgi:hypothetical protein
MHRRGGGSLLRLLRQWRKQRERVYIDARVTGESNAEVKMRLGSGASTGGAYGTELLACREHLAPVHADLAEVKVARDMAAVRAVRVLHRDGQPGRAERAGICHATRVRRYDRRPDGRPDVDPAMHAARVGS